MRLTRRCEGDVERDFYLSKANPSSSPTTTNHPVDSLDCIMATSSFREVSLPFSHTFHSNSSGTPRIGNLPLTSNCTFHLLFHPTISESHQRSTGAAVKLCEVTVAGASLRFEMSMLVGGRTRRCEGVLGEVRGWLKEVRLCEESESWSRWTNEI